MRFCTVLRFNNYRPTITRSTTETLPLPKINKQEESKIYKLASQKGFTDEEIAKTLKLYHSKRSAMYNTNNNNEAYNGKFGGAVNKPKPNIWWFIGLNKYSLYFEMLD